MHILVHMGAGDGGDGYELEHDYAPNGYANDIQRHAWNGWLHANGHGHTHSSACLDALCESFTCPACPLPYLWAYPNAFAGNRSCLYKQA